MTDDEFASEEMDFRSAVERFKEVCESYGEAPSDRISDAVADAGFSDVKIAP